MKPKTTTDLTVTVSADMSDMADKFDAARAQTRALTAELLQLARNSASESESASASVRLTQTAKIPEDLGGMPDRESLEIGESLAEPLNLPEYTAEQLAAMTPAQIEAAQAQAAAAYMGVVREHGVAADPDMVEKIEVLEDEGFVSIEWH